MKKPEIIEFEGRYLDLCKLRKEQLLIKKLIILELMELLEKYGFENNGKSYVNKKSLQEVKIKIKKINKKNLRII